jgi:hypothetical protein
MGTCQDGAQVGEARHSEERIRQQRVHKSASQFYPWMAEVLRVACRPRRTASVRASDLRNCDLTATIRHWHRTDVLVAASATFVKSGTHTLLGSLLVRAPLVMP